MFQTQEQDKTPDDVVSEVDISNLHEKKFQVVLVKMIKELGRRMNVDRISVKNQPSETKTTMTEMKNILEG